MEGFEEAYRGVPPWDIGRPQPAFVDVERSGGIVGPILDVGCGTGELALFFAGRGYESCGIDGAPTAIGQAKRKAKERNLAATFRVHDALRLEDLGQSFRTITDSGLFHVFPDEDWPRFARGLASVLEPGGRYWMLCFSEREPGDWGPRRVSQAEIRGTFQPPWRVASLVEAAFDTNLPGGRAAAWLASIERP